MRTIECDVAIVGAGASGLPAAIAAAETGARVVAIEKAPTTGGTGNMAFGLLAADSKLQRHHQVDLSVDEAYDKFMNYTHMRVDGRLVRKFLARSADTLEWMEGMGIRFYGLKKAFKKAEMTEHVIKPMDTGKPSHRIESGMIKAFTDRARELGVEFLLETRVEGIVVEGAAVAGVRARAKGGEELRVAARAAIIGTGGFGNNPEMIKAHCGLEWGKDIFNFRIPGNEGDGVSMAWAAGAAPGPMIMQVTCKLPHTVEEYPDVNNAFRQPNLVVNLDGERVMDESYLENMTFSGNAVLRQRGKVAFCLISEGIKKHYRKHGLDISNTNYPNFYLEGFDEQIEASLANGNPDVVKADSLPELARLAGIDPDGLSATVERYNEYCDQGYDEEFGKDRRYLRALRKGPYYAGAYHPAGYGSLGGISVDHELRALGSSGKPIAGLFAAGSDANAICGDSYIYVMPATTLGFAVNSGRMAGENAAAYALST